MAAQPEIFDYLTDDQCILERTPLETLGREGRLGVHRHCGYWQCMDTQRDRFLLEEQWNGGTAPWRVW
jgi:glucose-1-phosphate cytidylyltransferase